MIRDVKQRRSYNATLRHEQAQMTRRRILEAARRLIAAAGYSTVTMDGIANEAGVAYQTVYSVFGTKLRLAEEMIEAGWPHIDEALKLVEHARAADDPTVWLRTTARITRRINEPCGDLARFMRESGDPVLLARYRKVEDERLSQLNELATFLERSGRLRSTITSSEALAVVWAMTSADWYSQLVFQRRWKPARFEEWLGDALINLLLEPV